MLGWVKDIPQDWDNWLKPQFWAKEVCVWSTLSWPEVVDWRHIQPKPMELLWKRLWGITYKIANRKLIISIQNHVKVETFSHHWSTVTCMWHSYVVLLLFQEGNVRSHNLIQNFLLHRTWFFIWFMYSMFEIKLFLFTEGEFYWSHSGDNRSNFTGFWAAVSLWYLQWFTVSFNVM